MAGTHMFRITPATQTTLIRELIHIHANASAALFVHEAKISALTTLSESFRGALCIAATTNAVGSTLTPVALNVRTTCASTGYGPTSSVATGLSYLDSENVNTLNGYHFLPTPELRPLVAPGKRLVLRVDSTHPTDVVLDAWIKFEEFGK